MKSAGRERGKEIRKRPAEDARRQQNAGKMLNRGNEPNKSFRINKSRKKRTQNELKTNSILSAKSAHQSGKEGFGCQVSGVRGKKSRFQVSGARSAVAWENYAARLPTGHCPPEPAPENASRGTNSPQRGRLHTELSGSLGRGCYFSTLHFSTSRN